MASSTQHSWRTVIWLLIGFTASIAALELALSVVYPPKHLREVADAVADLSERTPHVLAISSSHGRSFHVLGREVERITQSRVTLTAVPLEGGKARNMEWVLSNRVAPLIDADASGRHVNQPLRQIIFGITWWDMCRRNAAPEWDSNVVSRAWRWEDYRANVLRNGITAQNRTYATAAWERSLRGSNLVKHRGALAEAFPSVASLVAFLGEPKITRTAQQDDVFLKSWQHDIETGHECVFAPTEQAALDRVVAFAAQRQLELTIVLFPLKPATITPTARTATLIPFAQAMREYGAKHGVRIVDMTEIPPLSDADFMADFDHVNEPGNLKFAAWALDHDLAFLQTTAPHSPATAAVLER